MEPTRTIEVPERLAKEVEDFVTRRTNVKKRKDFILECFTKNLEYMVNQMDEQKLLGVDQFWFLKLAICSTVPNQGSITSEVGTIGGKPFTFPK